MPLNTVNMVPLGHLQSVDIKQYADLLTGVMTDQPVRLSNQLEVLGQIQQQFTDVVMVPPPGHMKLYPKADLNFYKLDSNGVESPLGTGGGCTHEEFMPAQGATSITLADTPASISMLARDGLVQSAASGHYTLAGQNVNFSSPFNGTERIVVDYAMTTSSGGGGGGGVWTPPTNPVTISGSRDQVGSTVLDQLLTALAALGLIVDATTQ